TPGGPPADRQRPRKNLQTGTPNPGSGGGGLSNAGRGSPTAGRGRLKWNALEWLKAGGAPGFSFPDPGLLLEGRPRPRQPYYCDVELEITAFIAEEALSPLAIFICIRLRRANLACPAPLSGSQSAR